MKMVTCNECGWVYYAISRMEAIQEVQRGDENSNIIDYEFCSVCHNNYKNFRDSLDGDSPEGCKLYPIIDRYEDI